MRNEETFMVEIFNEIKKWWCYDFSYGFEVFSCDSECWQFTVPICGQNSNEDFPVIFTQPTPACHSSEDAMGMKFDTVGNLWICYARCNIFKENKSYDFYRTNIGVSELMLPWSSLKIFIREVLIKLLYQYTKNADRIVKHLENVNWKIKNMNNE